MHPTLTAVQSGKLECAGCGSPLRQDAGGFSCTACAASYPTVLGVPFLAAFEPRDMLGLIEVAAHTRNRDDLVRDADFVGRLVALCVGFHEAADKDAFRAANPGTQIFYFENRYQEWRAVHELLDGEDLTGCEVLDIGAGQGVDSWSLALRGARVTALEFSPLLCEAGRKGFPDLDWIGGVGHALPFANASFDHVFINAALHHMHDIPATIAEALRVLRPGGLLITSGDPFRAASAGQDLEFEIFDRNEAVLGGINEQIPRISEIFDTLEKNKDILDVALFTNILYGGGAGGGPDLVGWTAWDFNQDADLLKQRSGGLAMKVRLLAPWPHQRAVQHGAVLPADCFAEWLGKPDEVLPRLARLMPRHHVDAPFPGVPTKFDLLNGWRVAQSTSTTRTGYRRARLFLQRAAQKAAVFEMRAPHPATFAFLINGKVVSTQAVGRDWTRVSVDLSSAEAGSVYALEFRRQGEPGDFDAGCFDVRLPVKTITALADRAKAMVRRFLGKGGE